MTQFELVGSQERPPIWRTLLIALLGGFASLVSMAFSPSGWATGAESNWAVLVFLAALMAMTTLVIALFWRHRYPFTLAIASSLGSVVLPLGVALPLITLAALIGRRRGPAVAATMALTGLTSLWVAIQDARAQPIGASFMKSTFGPRDVDPASNGSVSLVLVLVLLALSYGTAVAIGLLVRSQRTAADVKVGLATERETSDRLGDEAARRQERERIAREVHDVMGHRLSLLNLHAGAMEANSGGDPRLQQSAALVRESAGAAMDDLRSLLAVLREPLGADPPELPLNRLREVISESFGAGQALSSSVFIEDAESASPTLSRAVYRIVQELLTNARKHAPQELVTLVVEGAPATGVLIDVQNAYRGGWGSAPPGASRGLAGIAERVKLLGGRFDYGLDQNGKVFRAHVELPWTTA